MIGTVKDGFERVTKRQKLYHSISQVITDRVCEGIVESLIQNLTNNVGVEPKPDFTELQLKLDSLLPMIQLQGSQKETNTSLSKFDKVLDKSYHRDITGASRSIGFDNQFVDKMLVDYFYRQGLFEVGDCLAKEAELEVETEARAQFLELYRVTESLKYRDIDPAMRWIYANSEKLKDDGPRLEMKLVSLKYFEKLKKGKSNNAFEYAKTHFRQFTQLHGEEIQKLFNALLWVGDLENSPQAKLLSSLCWDKTSKELTKQYYRLLDEPSNSPLAVVLSAGVQSLPKLLKMIRVMGLKKEEWEAMKQLPVDLELGNEFQFHSVFVCPVSREESNDENPPMMMPCRHVLCKQSIMRLGMNCRSRRFKCPYCPAQTYPSACRQLYL